MSTAVNELETKVAAARAAARKLARLPGEVKNQALLRLADNLARRQDEIIAANQRDRTAAKEAGMGPAMQDRLLLDGGRIAGIASDVRAVAGLPDPVGEVFDMRTLPNGLQVGRKRVPLGVIATIYESRPNVTIDISALCLKSGNAVILRGGKEALHSNLALAGIVQGSAREAGVPDGGIQILESTDRTVVDHMLRMSGQIDLIVPRGGVELIRFVAGHATMPVLAGGVGVCHTYVDRSAVLANAAAIVYNAKVQRPTVCNALDTILVHEEIAEAFLKMVGPQFAAAGVELHCDPASRQILAGTPSLKVAPATEQDWGREYLALIAAVKVVKSCDEALDHIDRYGSGHSEAIVTEDYSNAMRTDGGQFGLGAEVGISTQKLHARGPLGLKELTSYKWIIMGSGQTRP